MSLKESWNIENIFDKIITEGDAEILFIKLGNYYDSSSSL